MQTITHTFDVNKAGIKSTLKNTFTDNKTFIKELAQNAQRAGATVLHINFDLEKNELTVIDDGKGFSEEGWNSYFTVGQSGWGADVAHQKPYGIGCASALFQSKHMQIASNGYRVELDTQFFLEGGKVVRVAADTQEKGTSITLQLNDNTNLEKFDFAGLFEAFPIPVYVNGEPLPRKLAMNNDETTLSEYKTDIGTIVYDPRTVLKHISHTYKPELSLPIFCLLGFQIGVPRNIQGSHCSTRGYSAIHLDPMQCEARVPDRVSLINGDEIAVKVKQAFTSLVISVMEGLYCPKSKK
jgi:hypothetical protein